MTIYSQITGRLGNNLFQIAIAYSLAKQHKTDFAMIYNQNNPFEQEYISYFPEIPWKPRYSIIKVDQRFSEKHNGLSCFDIHLPIKQFNGVGDFFLDGYFQNENYFKEHLEDLRVLFLKKTVPKIDGYFIHVRRGDYVNHPVYTIDYTDYFKKAITHFPGSSKFYIVSDDIPYCKSWDLFKGLDVDFIDLDTLDTLHFMAGCKGGICANSSFSWWGAWLGGREIVTMPKQWINNGMNSQGVHFEGAIVIS